ncbi:SAF domain-containing protein [Mycolicibacterium bacteremicum]|uniref:Flagellar biosynthesis protein FlgA n=1 Tax=Mycolicibacterium bacteremicum TaxID=564198 RepID=A0A1W9YXN6_MYCBA|nr:SAF domain-containing protein [Mycolicibacterium bacteremicum]MCV7430756.1 flagellar biosynthesis protein FlgA [Mycolicibacterium bacteremicum]ORA04814.1 flagellar biosynthesis protein FlgA [Mycolicibacterium bacteremicum]
MGESLNPSALSRLRAALRPDWTRTVAARRVAAGLLVLLAAVAALRPDPAGERADVVVAAGDLVPGIPLTATDVMLESRLATTIPEGAQTEVTEVLGAHLTAPARRGEVLTDVRLLGSRLTEATAGPDARIVPIALADEALVELIRPGDVVDVLAVGDADARPEVIATRAVVAMVSAEPGGPAQRVVLVVLPRPAANAVAGAALTGQITVTFH